VAVVQISRIQVRRGQKNQGSGIPQLASGELGWAIDSRELYIGNGSVAEGSPAVGNTKVITEHDDLFTLADTYTYLNNISVQTGPNVTSPIKRTLQSRLDEEVSLRSFGGYGDGTDQTVILQRAIDQLYINSATKGTTQSRIKLKLPAGTYKISDTIFVPPYTSIIGDGIDKTVITMTGSSPVFKTVNSSSTPGVYADDSSSTALNQATNITISGLTISTVSTNQPAMHLQSCKNSEISHIKLTGAWSTGTSITQDNTAILISSLSSLVGSKENKFEHIRIKNFSVGVSSFTDIMNNHFNCCYLEDLGKGFILGDNTAIGSPSQQTGPSKNRISYTQFKNIDQEGLVIKAGTNNFSQNNVYEGVGNIGADEGNATYSVIDFGQAGNSSVEDTFTRSSDLGYNQTYITNYPYVSEIKGFVNSTIGNFHSLEVSEASSYTYFFRLPGDYTRTYEIEYTYVSNIVDAQRTGKMTIMLDTTNDILDFVDDFTYQGDTQWENNLNFQVQMINTDGQLGVDTVIVSMLNYTTNDQGYFNYKVKVLG
jgi:hypothetical protein